MLRGPGRSENQVVEAAVRRYIGRSVVDRFRRGLASM